MHGSRSGHNELVGHAEFIGTSNYAADNPLGLGWNATIGDDEISIHMPVSRWGWNARGCSSHYIGVEFSQPTESIEITDGQVRAFVWYVKEVIKFWPNLPMYFPTHAELDGTTEYGGSDGKTDVFHKGSPATIELRSRIMRELYKWMTTR